jgi:nitroreductase
MTPDPVAADHLLSTTRAVRRRLDLERPVDPALVVECLRLAVQAPTAGNEQTWRWVVVTDPDKRAALGRLYADAGRAVLQRNLEATDASDAQTRKVYESALHLADVLERVPVLVIPCIVGRVDGARNAQAATFYASIIPAAWSFQLALRSRGLGSCWTTLHLIKEKEAADLLGLPHDVTQVALIPVAHTVATDFRPASRPPVEEVLYWNSWSATRLPCNPHPSGPLIA